MVTPIKDPREYQSLEKGKCPDCGAADFLPGPPAGICQNVKCAGCGVEFNLGVFRGVLMVAERIG